MGSHEKSVTYFSSTDFECLTRPHRNGAVIVVSHPLGGFFQTAAQIRTLHSRGYTNWLPTRQAGAAWLCLDILPGAPLPNAQFGGGLSGARGTREAGGTVAKRLIGCRCTRSKRDAARTVSE